MTLGCCATACIETRRADSEVRICRKIYISHRIMLIPRFSRASPLARLAWSDQSDPNRSSACTQVRRRPASSGPEQAPAPRKRRTNVRGASPGSIIRRSSVLESLPQGSHYIFISAAEVPVSGISQETMERLFNR